MSGSNVEQSNNKYTKAFWIAAVAKTIIALSILSQPTALLGSLFKNAETLFINVRAALLGNIASYGLLPLSFGFLRYYDVKTGKYMSPRALTKLLKAEIAEITELLEVDFGIGLTNINADRFRFLSKKQNKALVEFKDIEAELKKSKRCAAKAFEYVLEYIDVMQMVCAGAISIILPFRFEYFLKLSAEDQRALTEEEVGTVRETDGDLVVTTRLIEKHGCNNGSILAKSICFMDAMQWILGVLAFISGLLVFLQHLFPISARQAQTQKLNALKQDLAEVTTAEKADRDLRWYNRFVQYQYKKLFADDGPGEKFQQTLTKIKNTKEALKTEFTELQVQNDGNATVIAGAIDCFKKKALVDIPPKAITNLQQLVDELDDSPELNFAKKILDAYEEINEAINAVKFTQVRSVAEKNNLLETIKSKHTEYRNFFGQMQTATPMLDNQPAGGAGAPVGGVSGPAAIRVEENPLIGGDEDAKGAAP